MSTESLAGKVVVITGDSSGIGKGTAQKYAAAGASVVPAARRDNLLEELAKQCESNGGKAIAVHTDVSVQSNIENLTQIALSTFGRIDIWINNAGGGAIGLFEEIPLADHVRVIKTDLLGTLYGSHFALNQFKKQGSGILINVASVLGKIPAPYFNSCAAAKYGVVGLSAAIRQELEVNKIKGIRVCTVMPTSMDTPFFEHAADYTGHKVVPIPPVYEPEQVVNALFSLATDPGDEIAVGGAGGGTGFVLMHQILPGLMEHMMAKLTHHELMEKSPSAPDTQGSLNEPISAGTGVSGGFKQ